MTRGTGSGVADPGRADEALLSVAVLGPLVVETADGAVHLGGERQRLLLAALALAGPDGATVEQLIERVWDTPPDPTHVGHTRTTVSRLRRRLPDRDGESCLATRPGGYRLDPMLVEVDAWRFKGCVVAARDTEDPDRREALLTEGLELWRGEIAADVAGPIATAVERTRLTDLRIDAEEELATLQLRTASDGDLAAIASRTSDLLATHPYRERLRAVEVEALARLGRPDEALTRIRTHQRRLAEDLGLDPSPRLTQIEQRILVPDEQGPPRGHLHGYRLHEVLLRGEHVIVHRATQPVLDRQVELTTVTGPFARSADAAPELDSLVQRLSRVAQDGLAAPLDAWREGGEVHVVEPLLPRAIDDPELGPWPLARVAALVAHIGTALIAAHRFGLVHGAVGPTTLRVKHDGSPVLVGLPRSWVMLRTTGDRRTRHDDVAALADAASRLLPTDTRDPEPADASARGFRDALTAARDDTAATTLDELVLAARAVEQATQGAAMPSRRDVGPNPYRGLAAFTAVDADVFAGREGLVAELCQELEGGAPLLVLTGPSGVGKSSVVAAGLVPAIRRGAVTGGDRWRVASLAPGRDGLAELAAALAAVSTETVGTAVRTIRGEPRTVNWSAVVAEVAPGTELLVVVDQLEELTAQPPQRARAFLDGLVALLALPRTRVVVTVRSDRLDGILSHPGFSALARRALWGVAPLTAPELEAAIRRPAAAAGVEIEAALLAELLRSMAGSPDALPLLQLTLQTMFDQRDSDVLTLASFNDLGSLAGAILQRGERLLDPAEPARVREVKDLFAALVTVGPNGIASRRQARVADVTETVTTDVIEAAVRERLVVVGNDPATREPVLDLAHEALLSSWPRLVDWIEESRHDLRERTTLVAAAELWSQEGEPRARLLRGAPLDRAIELVDAGRTTLPRGTRRFVDLSRKWRAEREQVEQRRRQRERRTLRGAVAAAVVTALLAGVAIAQQNRAREAATDLRVAALVRAVETTAASRPMLARQLAVRALQLRDGPSTRASLLLALHEEPRVTGLRAALGPVGDCPDLVAASTPAGVVAAWTGTDGSTLYVQSADGTVAWRRASPSTASCARAAPNGTRALVLTGSRLSLHAPAPAEVVVAEDDVLDAAWSPDASRVATIGATGASAVLRVRDGTTFRVLTEVTIDLPFPSGVRLVGQEAVVVAATSPSPVLVDTVARTARPLPPAPGPMRAATIAGSGQVVGTTADRLVVWSDPTLPPRTTRLVGTDPDAVVVTDNGATAAIGTTAGVELLDLDRMAALGPPIRMPGGQPAIVAGDAVVVLTPDGRLLEITTVGRNPLWRSTGIAAQVGAAHDDGQTLALADVDGWSAVLDGQPITRIAEPTSYVVPTGPARLGIADPRTRTFVAVDGAGRQAVLDLSDVWTPAAAVSDLSMGPSAGAWRFPAAAHGLLTFVVGEYSRDQELGQRVLVIDTDETVLVGVIDRGPVVAAAPVAAERIAVAFDDGRVELLDPDGETMARIDIAGRVTALHDDGDEVLVGFRDGSVVRWHPDRGTKTTVAVPGSDGAVLTLAPADDGAVVVVLVSGRVRLHHADAPGVDLASFSGTTLGGPVTVSDSTVHLVADGFLGQLSIDPSTWIGQACAVAATPIDGTAWRDASQLPPPASHPCDV